MNKYERIKDDLAKTGTGKMKVFGNSMMPIIKSGSLLTYEKRDSYEVDDIVFCKVKGRYIDAHLVTKKDPNKGYLIANNHGWENGWTHNISAKVVSAEIDGQTKHFK